MNDRYIADQIESGGVTPEWQQASVSLVKTKGSGHGRIVPGDSREFNDRLACLREENALLKVRLAKYEVFAKAHESWEARMILEGEQKILDNMSDSAYHEAMEIQRLRNLAMKG